MMFIHSTRDKIVHCSTLADALCGPLMANTSKASSSDASKYLSVTFEAFFTLMEDGDADVRTAADESLNRVIRTLVEAHAGRMQVRGKI